MNNKFSLSFGISLVIVGLLNIFFDIDNTILFGLSISTTVFSLVNMIVPKFDSKKLELLYIIPFVILISIFCYSDSLIKIDIISKIVNGKITNILTFVSFGFLFISEFANYKIEELKEMMFESKRVNQDYEYSNMILKTMNGYLSNLCKKKIVIDDESQEFLDEMEKLCLEKVKLAHINERLLSLGKSHYTLDEINDIYKLSNDILNCDKENNKNEKIKK